MGGWVEGVPSVGRPVTTKNSRPDSYFTCRAVTHHIQFSNHSGGRLVVVPSGGRPVTPKKAASQLLHLLCGNTELVSVRLAMVIYVSIHLLYIIYDH